MEIDKNLPQKVTWEFHLNSILKLESFSSQKKFVLGTNALSIRREQTEVVSPFEKGLSKNAATFVTHSFQATYLLFFFFFRFAVTNWEYFEKLIEYSLNNQLQINISEHPILMIEPPYNLTSQREKVKFNNDKNNNNKNKQ